MTIANQLRPIVMFCTSVLSTSAGASPRCCFSSTPRRPIWNGASIVNSRDLIFCGTQSRQSASIALFLKPFRCVCHFGCGQTVGYCHRGIGSAQALPNQFSQRALYLIRRQPPGIRMLPAAIFDPSAGYLVAKSFAILSAVAVLAKNMRRQPSCPKPETQFRSFRKGNLLGEPSAGSRIPGFEGWFGTATSGGVCPKNSPDHLPLDQVSAGPRLGWRPCILALRRCV